MKQIYNFATTAFILWVRFEDKLTSKEKQYLTERESVREKCGWCKNWCHYDTLPFSLFFLLNVEY